MNFDNANIDFKFLIGDFIESFQFYHSQDEVENLVSDMLKGKHVSILPNYLNVLGSDLKVKLSNMILENYEETNDENLKKYIEIIKEQDKKPEEKLEKKHKIFKIKRATTIGIVTAICLSNPTSKKLTKDEVTENSRIKIYQDQNFYRVENKSKPKSVTVKIKPKRKLNTEQEEKKRILNNYKKCKSIEDIKKRQKQLESVKWKKTDKIYPNCKLSAPVQRFIYEQSVLNKWPIDFTFSIIYAETRGGFTSSGEVSYNAPDNYDLGLTQQNTVSSLETFREKYHISYDEAFELLKNNDYANICSAFLEYREIAKRFNSYDPYEFAGCYNGWLNWKNNSISRAYVKEFKKGYDNVFTKHHNIEKNR